MCMCLYVFIASINGLETNKLVHIHLSNFSTGHNATIFLFFTLSYDLNFRLYGLNMFLLVRFTLCTYFL